MKPGTGRLMWVVWCRALAILCGIAAFMSAILYEGQGTDGTAAGLVAVTFAVLSLSRTDQ